MYKKSSYYISFYDEGSDSYLLYSFITKALIAVKKSQYERINDIFNCNNETNDSYVATLLKYGFLLMPNKDELDELRNAHALARDNSDISIAIGTTLACNFSCKYCYQKKNNVSLDKTIAKHIIQYINSVNKKEGQCIVVKWIGGEPLLNFDIMQYISRRINVDYKSVLYTNAYLLDTCIDDLKELNLKRIYLTLDGMPEDHDAIRYTKVDKNTHNKILNNIRLVLNRYPTVEIVVKMNFSNHSEPNIEKILDFYSEFKNRIRLNFGCIVDDIHVKSLDYVDYSLRYYGELLDNNFAIYKLPGNKLSGGCPAYNKQSISISPNGIIYKCVEGIGTNHFILGKIEDNSFFVDQRVLSSVNDFDVFNNEYCVNCLLFPYCMGGCLYRQYHNVKCQFRKEKINSVKMKISKYYNHEIFAK